MSAVRCRLAVDLPEVHERVFATLGIYDEHLRGLRDILGVGHVQRSGRHDPRVDRPGEQSGDLVRDAVVAAGDIADADDKRSFHASEYIARRRYTPLYG